MFISIPYLPKAKVTLAVGGFRPEGVEVVAPAALPMLPAALRGHADLGLCPIGGSEVVCPPCAVSYYENALGPRGFSVISGDADPGSTYPTDAAYNVVVAGRYALLNPKCCDRTLLRLLEQRFEIVPIRQGYAKCSAAPIGENVVITADKGIYEAASRKGLSALLAENDGVELPPYGCGFFGGATGMINRNTLAVNGSLDKMKSGAKIKEFLELNGVFALEISARPPFDTGSLIPLETVADNI